LYSEGLNIQQLIISRVTSIGKQQKNARKNALSSSSLARSLACCWLLLTCLRS